jgi:thiol:disulfide interchange protein DsbD
MPKPGGWMETVSKLFGILMLAIAVWMLDRVIPEYVIYLWAALFIGTGYYLLQYKHFLARTLMTMILIYGVLTFIGAISGATNVLKPLEKLTLSASASKQGTTQKLQWAYVKNITELEQAIANSNKPVMLDFWASWCVSCKELDPITFEDEQVIEKLKNFTLLKADVTQNNEEDKALQQRFKVFGPPALIFWDKNGQEINEAKIIGYKNPEDFLKIINKSF